MSNRLKSSVRTNWSVNKLSLKVVIIVICVTIAIFSFTSIYYKNKIEKIYQSPIESVMSDSIYPNDIVLGCLGCPIDDVIYAMGEPNSIVENKYYFSDGKVFLSTNEDKRIISVSLICQ